MFMTNTSWIRFARRVLALVITCVIWSSGMEAAHAVPGTISFSAFVRDERGAVGGAVNAIFRIFDTPTGGAPIWEERHPSVPVERGIFHVELGSLADEDLNELIFDGSTLYLEIVIEGDVMQQRITIQTVPYAYRAATADTLDGHTADDFLPSGSSLLCPAGQKMRGIDGATGNALCESDSSSQYSAAPGGGLSLSNNAFSIANAGVTTSKIAASAVTSSKIADGSVTSSEIADGNVTARDIASGAVISSKIANGAVTIDKIGFGLTRTVNGPYSVSRTSGGYSQINLTSSSNSFCSLSQVKMTEVDNTDESGECQLFRSGGYWVLRATSDNHPGRTDPRVYCGAFCLSW